MLTIKSGESMWPQCCMPHKTRLPKLAWTQVFRTETRVTGLSTLLYWTLCPGLLGLLSTFCTAAVGYLSQSPGHCKHAWDKHAWDFVPKSVNLQRKIFGL
jgi:hypothetical protein